MNELCTHILFFLSHKFKSMHFLIFSAKIVNIPYYYCCWYAAMLVLLFVYESITETATMWKSNIIFSCNAARP